MKTQFASPDRASLEKLKLEILQAKGLPMVQEFTEIIPDAFAILNRHRQIIYCNDALLKFMGLEGPDAVYGKRLGEALNCIHSAKTEGGCGTTAACLYCGAVNAMVNSLDHPNSLNEEECRLTTGNDQTSFDFRVRTKTLEILNDTLTLIVVKDNSPEKRKQALERVFFHDILNTAGGIQGLIELIKESSKEEMDEYINLLETSSNTLVEEINAQRELLAAENQHLEMEQIQLNSLDILNSVFAVYQSHPVARTKTIKVMSDSASVNFSSDPRLLIRVIGNMVKNALEAEPPGITISMAAVRQEGGLEFRVYNPSVMLESAKMQVFQRSYSTKGMGRGLGTYSIKLLGEKYLKGKVGFTSIPAQGTCFFIALPIERP